MNEIANAFISSMKTISIDDINNVAKQSTTLTIETQITEVLDRGVGLYKVKYLENYFNVYSSNTDNNYQVDEIVYVLVPSGDFSKEKYILGSVSPSANTYIPTTNIDEYIEISNDLLSLNTDVIELSTYKTESKDLSILNTSISQEIYNYLKTFNTFGLSCNIKTNIEKNQQVRGNYGLKLFLPIIKTNYDNSKTYQYKEVSLDISTMTGNPYDLLVETSQNIYITFNKDNEEYDYTKAPILQAFVKDFTLENPEYPIDIWISNIQFKAIEVLTIDQLSGYHLIVKADSGNYFLTNGSNVKTLTPYLKINGKDTSFEGCPCYWFRQDASITVDSEDYNSIGGIGWACLNEKTDIVMNDKGTKTFKYDTSKKTYKITKSNFYSIKYKCVIVYDGKGIEGEIKITDLTKDIKIELSTITNNNTIPNAGLVHVTCTVDLGTSGIDPSYLNFVWARYDKNNDYIDNNFYTTYDLVKVSDKIYKKEITFDASFVDSYNTIRCTVYSYNSQNYEDKTLVLRDENGNPIDENGNSLLDENGNITGELVYQVYKVYNNELIGTEDITLFSTPDYNYIIVWENADILYKYDADGDSPFVADYDGPISSRMDSTKPLKFKIYDKYGNEFTDLQYQTCDITWIVPGHNYSMLKIPDATGNDYTYELRSRGRLQLSYSIDDVFNASKTNNTIFVKAKISNNTTITSSISITFIKDGESGTNGTKYSAIIKYNDGTGSHALNEYDEDGVNHNAKIIYLASSNDESIEVDPISKSSPLRNWYIYTYDENKIGIFKKLNAAQAQFNIELYKDGKQIQTTNNFSVEWGWYDSNITKPCLNIDKQTGIITQKEEWSDYNSSYCNIIQAKIKVTSTSNTNADLYIFAYYPIDITRISNIQEISSLTGGSILSYNGIVPTLTGGFYSVLYSSDGKNPKYDSSKYFQCLDSLQNTGSYDKYQYNWYSSSENLLLSPIDSEETLDIDSNTSLENGVEKCRVRPATSWLNGDTKNFLRVELQRDNGAEALYQENFKDVQNAMLIAKGWKDYYSDDALNSGKEDLKYLLKAFSKSDLENYFTSSKDLIEERSIFISYISVLFDKLEAWRNYLLTLSTETLNGYVFDTTYKNVYNALSTAKENLINFGNYESNSYCLENLRDLSNLSLEPSTYYKGLLGNAYKNIQPYINDFQNNLLIYNNEYTTFTSTLNNNLEKGKNFYLLKNQLKEILRRMEVLSIAKQIKNNGDVIANNLIMSDWKTNYASYEKSYNKIIKEKFDYNEIKIELNNLFEIMKKWSDNKKWYETIDGKQIAYGSKLSSDGEIWFDNKLNTAITSYNDKEKAYNHFILQNNMNQASIVHIRPILFTMNSYEMSNINAWDGNKIYIDGDGEGSYILAPQMGAGVKDEANRFTGLVMGIRNLNNSDGENQNEVGLYGYKNGISSFELNAQTGEAKFGVPNKGQIVIKPGTDPQNDAEGIIYGGNFKYNPQNPKNGSGLEINLTKPTIRYGTGYFEVDENGHLKATEAKISGELSAIKGTIGGWIIDQTKIYSNIDDKLGRLTLSSRVIDEYRQDINGNYIYLKENDDEKSDYYAIDNFYYANKFSYTPKYKIQEYISFLGEAKEVYPDSYPITRGNYNTETQIFTDNIYGSYFKVTINNIDYVITKYWRKKEVSEYNGGTHIYYEALPDASDGCDAISFSGLPRLKTRPSDSTFASDSLYPDGYFTSYQDIKITSGVAEYEIDNIDQDKYCILTANGQETDALKYNFYLIEKGTYENDVWQRNNSNGYWIKIIMNGEDYYSKLYSYKNNKYIESFLGDYIRINDTYYQIQDYYILEVASNINDVANNNSKILLRLKNNNNYNSIYTIEKGNIINGSVWSSSIDGEQLKIFINDKFYYTYRYSIKEGCGIYSHEHTSFDDATEGFFLGSRGLSLGSNIQLSSSKSDPYFKMSTGGGYQQSEVYIASDGISLGRNSQFSVNTEGTLIAKDAYIKGDIEMTSGKIGYFSVINGGLEGNNITISPFGYISKDNGEDFVAWRSDLDRLEDMIGNGDGLKVSSWDPSLGILYTIS